VQPPTIEDAPLSSCRAPEREVIVRRWIRSEDDRRRTAISFVLAVLLSPFPVQAQIPAIVSNKTVGTDPFTCATTDSLLLPPGGGLVTYCFEVTNTGGVTFTSLDLVDSELGALLTAQPFVLPPASSMTLTQTVPLIATTLNFATWTASITPTIAVSDVQSALVTVQGSPGPNLGIPTLSTPTLLLLALLLCGAGLVTLRRLS
jgi:hypothetical protein